VYLSGAPGTGKTTLMHTLTAGYERAYQPQPFGHELLLPASSADCWPSRRDTPAELGRRRDDFGGTDALPLNVQPKAVTWITTIPHTLVLAEGDRLANLGFLRAAAAAGYEVYLLALEAPGDVLDARCAARGSAQNRQWRAGRLTKATRLAATAEVTRGLSVHRLDTRNPVAELAAEARAYARALTRLTPASPAPAP
jgi:hypothetical protein